MSFQFSRAIRMIGSLLSAVLLSACVSNPPAYDYSEFKASKPKSIVVLPPLNTTNDVTASNSVLSHATYPLAESGYYVLPVTLVKRTFHENGIDVPGEMHAVPFKKLHDIFGADAALYLTVSEFGSEFRVLQSVTVVSVSGQLVDLRSGKTLWSGSSSMTDDSGFSVNNSLVSVLVSAVANQVANSVSEKAHRVAQGVTNNLLFAGPEKSRGLLYGPRSPHNQQQ